jgi:Ca-activated chloride channel family protein
MKAQSFAIEWLEAITPEPDPVARMAAREAALGEFARTQVFRRVAGGRDLEHIFNLRELSRQLPHPERERTEFRRSSLANWVAGAMAACVVGFGAAALWSQDLFQERYLLLAVAGMWEDARPVMVELPPPPALAPPPDVMMMPALSLPLAENSAPADVAPPAPQRPDRFGKFEDHAFTLAAEEPVSTFSIDVDTTSYSFIRRQLHAGVLPQKDAVRAEEMINYFDYSWPAPDSPEQPFRATIAVSDSPWGESRKLVHIGIKGYELPAHEQPDVNLVLLLDVSGSMDEPDRLPLVKQSVDLLLRRLKLSDTVAIVAYAGEASVVLRPTEVRQWHKIRDALQSLKPGGATAGAAGIQLAYELARSSFRRDGVNRILLATDGDFNVGMTDVNALRDYVARQREKGIFLSVLGFGVGYYDDETAQALAQNGNGVAAYIDTLAEAEKVLSQEATASLFTIAKDVKVQVEFNPATVTQYRLLGYETRSLRREDFEDDAIDAGDIGSGHTVTAIYEITPAAQAGSVRGSTDGYGWLKIRYKRPEARASELLVQGIPRDTPGLPSPVKSDVEFATAVAAFAQKLRGNPDTRSLSDDEIIRQAQAATGDDPYGYRAEFVELVRKAQSAGGGD